MTDAHKTLTFRSNGEIEIDKHDLLEDAHAFAVEECRWEFTDAVRVIEVSTGKIVETLEGWNGDEEAFDDDDGWTDVDADANTLASAGMGTDEDYGYFGGEDY